MKYNKLGKTGIQVSQLGLGTVELGLNYGINKSGNFGKPDEKYSIYLLHKAADLGINLFDTAPSYGCSEEILGKAFANREDCIIATKVNIPPEEVEKFIISSLTQSHQKLRRKYLDIVQVHNATSDTFLRSDIFEILLKGKDKGNIRFIGASVYEPENALAAIDSGMIDVLQIAYNLLDQRMRTEVISEAVKNGIGILARSPYFKGVLTSRAQYLPESCQFLKTTAQEVKTQMGIKGWDDLAKTALRFSLSTPGISSVLIGIQTLDELEFAIRTEKQGKLSDGFFEKLLGLGIEDKYWLNPSNWPIG